MSEQAPGPTGAWRGPGVARATYGLIVVMSILAVWSDERHPDASSVLESLIGTALIFWLAHIYAEVTEAAVLRRRRGTRAELLAIVEHEWPLVEVAILPAVVVTLSALGALGAGTAISVALYVCLLELAATGALAAWRTGARGAALALRGTASFGLGVAIIILKTLVH
jgi:hypothetical protein